MKSYNKALLIGNAGKDPELRYTQSGTPVSTFSLATNEAWKNDKGELQKRTEWHNIVAWGKSAEDMQRFVKKGSPLHIEGRIQTRSWEDKATGVKKYITEIIVASWILLEKMPQDAAAPVQQAEEPAGEQSDLPF